MYTPTTERDRTTYADMLDYLKDIRDWQALATLILPGDAARTIERIRATYNGNTRECKKALFIEYLENGDKSWNTVIAALLTTGNDDLAEDIKRKLGLLNLTINYCTDKFPFYA